MKAQASTSEAPGDAFARFKAAMKHILGVSKEAAEQEQKRTREEVKSRRSTRSAQHPV